MGISFSSNNNDTTLQDSVTILKNSLLRNNYSTEMQNELNQYFKNNIAPTPYQGGDSESFVGGSDNGFVLGGANELQDYGNSVYSQAKEKLIRNIAKEVFSALKIQGSNYAQSAPISEVVKHLAKVVPNPKKGRSFSAAFNKSSSNQSQVLNALVNALNKHYGDKLIPLDATPAEKMRHVSEVMHTLFQGLHTEFMSVAGDVLRVLRNLQTLHEYIDASYKKQKKLVDSSGDSGLKEQADSVEKFYEQLKGELNKQMAMISNMLDVVVGPTGKDLIMLLEDSNEFTGLVKDLKANLGTSEFGTHLSYLLTGVSSVAHAAAMIEKALKKLGMSIKDFKSARNQSELRLKIMDHIQKKSPSSKELDKMMAAANVIYKHNFDHKSIAEEIKGGNFTGGDSDDDADDMENHDADVMGGDDSDDGLPAYWSKKSLSKKIKNKEKYRNQLLKDFGKLLKAHYRIIVNSSVDIVEGIDKTIPITDDLDRFITVFCNMPGMNEENLHIALSGYAKDTTSKNNREKFLNNYNLVLLAIEPLMKGPGGAAFKKLHSAITEIIKAINNFSDKIVNSLTEIHIDRPEEISAAVRGSVRDFFGGDDEENLMGSNSYVEFENIKMKMQYKFNISHIKTNLSRVADEMKEFGTDYEQVLGEEAGWLINKIKEEYNDLIEKTNPENKTTAEVQTIIAQLNGNGNGIIHNQQGINYSYDDYINRTAAHLKHLGGDESKAKYKGLVKLWERQRDAKVKMVEVAQAVDLYLRSFADGIARHPDSIKSIIKMLNQVELVAKWFNNRSGDNLAGLFEVFPGRVNGVHNDYGNTNHHSGSIISENEGKLHSLPVKNGDHYYQWVEDEWKSSNHIYLPGNPTLGIELNDAKDNKKFVEGLLGLGSKTIKSMRALENILSAFSTIGSKFGDLNPQSATFMNPGQIFNALCEYITCSAFTSGFAPQSNTLTNAVHTGYLTQGGINYMNQNITVPEQFRDQARVKKDGNWQNHVTDLAINLSKSRQNAASNSGTVNAYGIISGVSSTHNAATLKKYTTIAMSSLPDVSGDQTTDSNDWDYYDATKRELHVDSAGWNDRMFDTDKLFIMTIKSIVCKVFTVVDAYRLFNRPTVDRETHDSLNPVRTILGGADGGAHNPYVPIISEATELYMRLPLLAEWYREMFGFKKNRTNYAARHQINNDDWVLSIIPSIDGTWSDLVKLIFDNADYVNSGNYSETQVQKIIEAVNKAYKAYKTKYPRCTNRNIINSFVLEMNRVFGFMKQAEIDKYFESRRDYLKGTPDDPLFNKDFLDYDILEAEDQFGRNPAPSDRFVNITNKTKQRKQRNLIHLQKAIEDLRLKIDTDFRNFTKNNAIDSTTNNTGHSFRDTIKAYQKDLDNATGPQDKYKVVLGMLQGSNRMVKASADKLIMLHEAVVAPLFTLYNTYKVLNNFNSLVHGQAFENIIGWSRARTNVQSNISIRMTIANFQDLRNSYKKYLKDNVYKNADEKHDLENIVSKLINDELYLTNQVVNANNASINTNSNTYGLESNIVVGNNNNQDQPLDLPGIKWDLLLKEQIAAVLDLTTNSNNLVTISIGSTGHINLDFSRLEETMLDLLENVKSNINKLRLEFAKTPEIINRYEDVENVGSTRWFEDNLVQKLFRNRDGFGLEIATNVCLRDTIVRASKPDLPTPAQAGGSGWENGGVGISMENAFSSLIYWSNNHLDIKFSSNYMSNNFKTFPFNIVPLHKNRGDLTANDKQILADAINHQDFANNPDVNVFNKLTPLPLIGFILNDSNGEVDAKELNNWNLDFTQVNSLLFRFNQLFHRYLYDNMDNNTLKIYTPLFESFMHGPASLEVIQGKAFPNVYERSSRVVGNNNPYDVNANNNNNANRRLPGPAENTVLFHSSVLLMKSLISTMDPLLKKKLHSYETVAEIPEHIKERMRSTLPYYSKLFNQIYERANLLRGLLSNTKIKNNIELVAVNGINRNANTVEGSVPLPVDVEGKSSQEYTEYLIALLHRLTQLSQGAKQCADLVYKELHDVNPFFMDIRKDFSKDYRQTHNALPLMPASNLLLPQNIMNQNPSEWNSDTLLLPSSVNGSDVYKFNYAARLVLGRNDVEPQLNQMPGAIDVYERYTSAANKSSMISPNEYKNTILTMTKICRFINDGVSHGRLFAQHKYTDLNQKNYNANNANNPIPNNRYKLPTSSVWKVTIHPREHINCLNNYHNFQIHNNFNIDQQAMTDLIVRLFGKHVNDPNKLNDHFPLIYQFKDDYKNNVLNVLNLAENPNYTKNKEDLASTIKTVTDDRSGNRDNMRTANILDLNIVPVNVHAFMREVPFVNILNYSYTFDRMVHDFVIPSYVKNQRPLTVNNLMIKPNSQVNSTRELFVKLLTYPYANLSASGNIGKEYYALLANLFNGNDDLKLGRPRYLSDQLWHKALLTSSAQIVAGQQMHNHSGSYSNNFPSLEGGPAAYEAQRSIVRFGYDKLNKQQNITDLTTESKNKVNLVIDNLQNVDNNTKNILNSFNIYFADENKLALAMNANDKFIDHIPTFLNDLINNLNIQQLKQLVEQYTDCKDLINNFTFERVEHKLAYYKRVYNNNNGPRTEAGIDALVNNNNAGLNAFNNPNIDLTQEEKKYEVQKVKELEMQLLQNNDVVNINDNDFKLSHIDGNAHINNNIADNDAKKKIIYYKNIVNSELHQEIGSLNDLVRKMLMFNLVTAANTPIEKRNLFKTLIGAIEKLEKNNIYEIKAEIEADGSLNNHGVKQQAIEFLNLYQMTNLSTLNNLEIKKRRLILLMLLSCAVDFSHINKFVALYKSGLLDLLLNIIICSNKLSQPTRKDQWLLIPSNPVATEGLKFWGKGGDNKETWRVNNLGGRNMSAADTIYCAELGIVRFNTKLVRNLTWLVQLQRIMRVVMTDHLDWIASPVIKGLKITNPVVTEYESNDQYTQDDFNGVRYNMF